MIFSFFFFWRKEKIIKFAHDINKCLIIFNCLTINKLSYESVRNRFHFNSRFV